MMRKFVPLIYLLIVFLCPFMFCNFDTSACRIRSFLKSISRVIHISPQCCIPLPMAENLL